MAVSEKSSMQVELAAFFKEWLLFEKKNNLEIKYDYSDLNF